MVFAEQTGRALEAVDLLINSTIESVQMERIAGGPMSDVETALQRRIRGIRQLSAILAVDEDGHVLVSTEPGGAGVPPEVLNGMRDRYRADPHAGMLISPPFQTGDGRFNALLARPMLTADGSFRGFAAGSLSLSYFEDFYRAVDLSENGAINLHLRDGTVLARYPHSDKMIGSSYGDLPPFTEVLSHAQAGTLVMDSPIDGNVRVLAIRALRAFPVAVMVSVDQGRLLIRWRHQSVILTAISLIMALVSACLLLALSRRSRQREQMLEETRFAYQLAERAKDRLMQQIAERERAEGTLRLAQRVDAVGQLTGGLAHDFNNLLTVILGNVEFLRRRTAPDQAASARLDAIREAAQRGATLTSHLLSFARRQTLLPTALDLNDVLSSLEPLLQSACGGAVHLAFDLAPHLKRAMADRNQVEVAVLNLVINARDAMAAGGTVVIETRNRTHAAATPDGPPLGDYVSVTVRDTGVGIAPEILPRVFEPFFTTKPAGTASGLGLSQVYGMAHQSGGDVTIDSAVGYGTSVTIDLPRAPADATSHGSEWLRPRHGGRHAAVLLVDDDDAARAVTQAMLEELGHDVHAVGNGEAALKVLERGIMADMLLTDLVMPRMNGSQLAAAATTLRPDLRVGFITGYANEIGDIMDQRARLICKPFQPAELQRLIDSVLATEDIIAPDA